MVKKKNANDPDEEKLSKLMKLTKLLKTEKVKVAKKGPPAPSNKWRSSNPRFAPKTKPAAHTVDAGGMQVDPALREQYEQWRQDKIQEQKDRREMAERRLKAAEEARKAMKKEKDLPPEAL